MLARDALRFTLRSVLAHRLRSALTSLGIGIGVTAVVLLTSIGQGVSQYIVEEFTQFGTNILAIQPGKANTLGVSAGVFNSVRPLSLADAEALRRAPYATHSVPLVSGQASVEARGRERSVMVFAVGPAFDIAFSFDVALGEFLPDDELDRARPVQFIIGEKLAECDVEREGDVERRAHGENHHRALASPGLHRSLAGNQGHRVSRIGRPAQCLGVGETQGTHGIEYAGGNAQRVGLARLYGQDVGSELGEFLDDVLADALADGGQQDHGRDADADPQRRQRAAQAMRQHRAEREP